LTRNLIVSRRVWGCEAAATRASVIPERERTVVLAEGKERSLLDLGRRNNLGKDFVKVRCAIKRRRSLADPIFLSKETV
jgi:hypothetical protein